MVKTNYVNCSFDSILSVINGYVNRERKEKGKFRGCEILFIEKTEYDLII